MSTQALKKISIPLEAGMVRVINDIANHEHKSTSSIIRELIFDSLERREDIALAKIAELRDIEGKKLINHDKAWN
jgi:predicted DNA-binding protein